MVKKHILRGCSGRNKELKINLCNNTYEKFSFSVLRCGKNRKYKCKKREIPLQSSISKTRALISRCLCLDHAIRKYSHNQQSKTYKAKFISNKNV